MADWAVGVTTCQERLTTLLPKTLESLRSAGFQVDRLFADGTTEAPFPGPWSLRDPKVGVVGNWLLGAWELYIRKPACHYYAMFQDDLVAVKDLRDHAERTCKHENAYWNLYTQMCNEGRAARVRGWFESAEVSPRMQGGKGALGLVFSREGLRTLLSADNTSRKPAAADNPGKSVDGMVVTSMNQAGWREYCFSPSLLQHKGVKSACRDMAWTVEALTFPGEGWSATGAEPSPKEKLLQELRVCRDRKKAELLRMRLRRC